MSLCISVKLTVEWVQYIDISSFLKFYHEMLFSCPHSIMHCSMEYQGCIYCADAYDFGDVT